MDAKLIRLGLAASLLICGQAVAAPRKPAPEPSRYGYTIEVDEESLPKGVTVKKVVDGKSVRYFIKNTSEVPLVINERFQNEVLVTGSKLVDEKVYGYFPSGVPMEGMTHLKGWYLPQPHWVAADSSRVSPQSCLRHAGQQHSRTQQRIQRAEFPGDRYCLRGQLRR